VRLWTELQVRCHVPVQARRDLRAGLQVRCLKTPMALAIVAAIAGHEVAAMLAGIATRYGRTKADEVASAFEFQGFSR
jgi:hypothetical protein